MGKTAKAMWKLWPNQCVNEGGNQKWNIKFCDTENQLGCGYTCERHQVISGDFQSWGRLDSVMIYEEFDEIERERKNW